MAEGRRTKPVLGKKETREDEGERMSLSTAEMGGRADKIASDLGVADNRLNGVR